ncbi:MAG: cell surface protein, partial [Nanoarchaeota archaeon]
MSTALQEYMDKALGVLKDFGLSDAPREEDKRLAELLQDVAPIDEARVLAIANVIQYMGKFNELV